MKKTNPSKIRLVECNISLIPLDDDWLGEVKDVRDDFFKTLKKNPKKALKMVNALREKYPDFPPLSNWFIVASGVTGLSEEELGDLIENEYKKFPTYLYSRCNYAKLLLYRGEYEKVPEVFDNKYNLIDLYPDQDTFYAGDFVAFFSVLTQYLSYKHDFDIVEKYLDILEELAPNHPDVQDAHEVYFLELFNALQTHVSSKGKEKMVTKKVRNQKTVKSR